MKYYRAESRFLNDVSYARATILDNQQRHRLPSANRLHLLQCPVKHLGHQMLPMLSPARATGGNMLFCCATNRRRLIGSIEYNGRRLAEAASGATTCSRLIAALDCSIITNHF
ncbi:hypothetical protein AVEN_52230-1 [Araneus ventricosus]|uniref:Uncharacterized protein n=1 Tax=Araneus ventricosus TaxID=182803 RepID=A0A4Y2WSX3_ARAVE|nr:hypothetical protein AVEN_52230-1 [Araneus ventricosus]